MDVNLEHIKIELIQWLVNLNDEELLKKILELKESNTEYSYGSISKLEQESIQSGIEDADNGKLISHSQAKKIYERWL